MYDVKRNPLTESLQSFAHSPVGSAAEYEMTGYA